MCPGIQSFQEPQRDKAPAESAPSESGLPPTSAVTTVEQTGRQGVSLPAAEGSTFFDLKFPVRQTGRDTLLPRFGLTRAPAGDILIDPLRQLFSIATPQVLEKPRASAKGRQLFLGCEFFADPMSGEMSLAPVINVRWDEDVRKNPRWEFEFNMLDVFNSPSSMDARIYRRWQIPFGPRPAPGAEGNRDVVRLKVGVGGRTVVNTELPANNPDTRPDSSQTPVSTRRFDGLLVAQVGADLQSVLKKLFGPKLPASYGTLRVTYRTPQNVASVFSMLTFDVNKYIKPGVAYLNRGFGPGLGFEGILPGEIGTFYGALSLSGLLTVGYVWRGRF